jgi:hypothetical protein
VPCLDPPKEELRPWEDTSRLYAKRFQHPWIFICGILEPITKDIVLPDLALRTTLQRGPHCPGLFIYLFILRQGLIV